MPLAGLFGALAYPYACRAMAFEQMMELPGASLLMQRANETIAELGPPAAIRDHGRGRDEARSDCPIGAYSVPLSAAAWNLIYARELAGGNQMDWVNPRPTMPGQYSGLDTLVVYTKPDDLILDLDEESGEINVRRAAGPLEAHAVYGVACIPLKGVPWQNFISKWGPPDEQTVDEKMQPVNRYWVPLHSRGIPIALFAVDVIRDARGNAAVITLYNGRAGFVAEELLKRWKALPEEESPLPDKTPEETPDGRGGAPAGPDLKLKPGPNWTA